MDRVKRFVFRIKLLSTGIAEWEDLDTGHFTREKLDWKTRWVLAGVHAYDWWWVRKWGKDPCGCTFNPLTGKRLLVCWGHAKARLDA